MAKLRAQRAKKRRRKVSKEKCSRLMSKGLVHVEDEELVGYLDSISARVVVIRDRKINFQKFFAKPYDIKAARALAAILKDRSKCCCTDDIARWHCPIHGGLNPPAWDSLHE